MNFDQQQSREEDYWVQQSWNENEYFDILSSPIEFGRQNHKIKYKNAINTQDYDSQIQQIGQISEDQKFNQISINSLISQRKQKIRKNNIIENTKSKQEFLKKLVQCQNLKFMIEGLERSLIKIS